MASNQIPPADHVSRFCKPGTFDGEVITSAAFMLRTTINEKYLSVNWLEKIHPSERIKQISKAREIYLKKFPGLSSKQNGLIAVLKTGLTYDHVLANSPKHTTLDFRNLSSREDRSYSGIFNLDINDQLLEAELIAQTVQENFKLKP